MEKEARSLGEEAGERWAEKRGPGSTGARGMEGLDRKRGFLRRLEALSWREPESVEAAGACSGLWPLPGRPGGPRLMERTGRSLQSPWGQPG